MGLGSRAEMLITWVLGERFSVFGDLRCLSWARTLQERIEKLPVTGLFKIHFEQRFYYHRNVYHVQYYMGWTLTVWGEHLKYFWPKAIFLISLYVTGPSFTSVFKPTHNSLDFISKILSLYLFNVLMPRWMRLLHFHLHTMMCRVKVFYSHKYTPKNPLKCNMLFWIERI